MRNLITTLLGRLMFAVAILVALSACNKMNIRMLPYPATVKDSIVDNYFGVEVADPYRWLEDDNSEATAEWVKAQNTVTFDYLQQIPFRSEVRERLTEIGRAHV